MHQTTFDAPDAALAVGTRHAGFTVTHVEAVPEISGQAYVLRHDASGARALWLACADVNKSFAISFKTPPADDTGVFHILEPVSYTHLDVYKRQGGTASRTAPSASAGQSLPTRTETAR